MISAGLEVQLSEELSHDPKSARVEATISKNLNAFFQEERTGSGQFSQPYLPHNLASLMFQQLIMGCFAVHRRSIDRARDKLV